MLPIFVIVICLMDQFRTLVDINSSFFLSHHFIWDSLEPLSGSHETYPIIIHINGHPSPPLHHHHPSLSPHRHMKQNQKALKPKKGKHKFVLLTVTPCSLGHKQRRSCWSWRSEGSVHHLPVLFWLGPTIGRTLNLHRNPTAQKNHTCRKKNKKKTE